MYYTFDGDPKMYKTVVDATGTELELVTREISPNELRSPALEQSGCWRFVSRRA